MEHAAGQRTEREGRFDVPRRYAIDPDWFHQQGRSLEGFLISRRCASCQQEIHARPTSPAWEEHLERIPGCCSQQEGYLSDGMLLREVIFRLLLRAGNAPRTAEDIHRELAVHLEQRSYSRVLPLRWVERLLETDTVYGIRPVQAD